MFLRDVAQTTHVTKMYGALEKEIEEYWKKKLSERSIVIITANGLQIISSFLKYNKLFR